MASKESRLREILKKYEKSIDDQTKSETLYDAKVLLEDFAKLETIYHVVPHEVRIDDDCVDHERVIFIFPLLDAKVSIEKIEERNAKYELT